MKNRTSKKQPNLLFVNDIYKLLAASKMINSLIRKKRLKHLVT